MSGKMPKAFQFFFFLQVYMFLFFKGIEIIFREESLFMWFTDTLFYVTKKSVNRVVLH